MATIRKRMNKNGTATYQVSVRIVGQPMVQQSFRSWQEAVEWGDAMSAAARSSVNALPDTKSFRKMILKDAIKEFESSGLCSKSYKSVAPTLLKHVEHISLGAIDRQFVLRYISQMRATNSTHGRLFADGTIKKHLGALSTAIKHAAAKHRVNFDTSIFRTKGVEGEWSAQRNRTLSDAEEARLRAIIPTRKLQLHWELLIDLAIETGARESELVLMEKKEVDLTRRAWIIPAKHTKMDYSRIVPLSIKATAIVAKLFAHLEDRNAAFLEARNNPAPDPILKSTRKYRDDDPKRPKSKRKPKAPPIEHETRLFHVFATPDSVSSGFRKLVKKAGLIDFRFHDLRHTAVTRMLLNKRGLDPYKVMRIVGHKSIEMLHRYANFLPEDLLSAME